MRNLKKFLALVLAMMMAFSMMITVNASWADWSTSNVSDFAANVTDEYSEAVQVLNQLGVFTGYQDGSFHGDKTITRAEVATVIYRIATGDTEEKSNVLNQGVSPFDDVGEKHWAAGQITYAYINNYVAGVGNNKYAPETDVTGYEVLAMILRVIGYNKNDDFQGKNWKELTSGTAWNLGITKGISGTQLEAPASRALVAELLFRTIAKTSMVQWNIVKKDYENVDGIGSANSTANVGQTLAYKVFKLVGGSKAGDGTGTAEAVATGNTGAQNYNIMTSRVKADVDGKYDAPLAKWYKNNNITALNTISVRFNPVKIYTTSVKGDTLYADAKAASATMSGNALSSVDYNVDGRAEASEGNISTLVKNGGTLASTGKGVLTELYVADGKVFVTVVNTYVAKSNPNASTGKVGLVDSTGATVTSAGTLNFDDPDYKPGIDKGKVVIFHQYQNGTGATINGLASGSGVVIDTETIHVPSSRDVVVTDTYTPVSAGNYVVASSYILAGSKYEYNHIFSNHMQTATAAAIVGNTATIPETYDGTSYYLPQQVLVRDNLSYDADLSGGKSLDMFDKNQTLYFDDYGYVVYLTDTQKTSNDTGYLLVRTGAFSRNISDSSWVAAYQVKMADGTETTIYGAIYKHNAVPAQVDGAEGFYHKTITESTGYNAENGLYAYEIIDGYYVLTRVDAGPKSGDQPAAGKPADSDAVVKGYEDHIVRTTLTTLNRNVPDALVDSTAGDLRLLSDNTAFIIANYDKTGITSYNYYKGLKNIPNMTVRTENKDMALAAADRAYLYVEYVYDSTTGEIVLVYVRNAEITWPEQDNSAKNQMIYVLDKEPQRFVTAYNTHLKVLVNGVVQEMNFARDAKGDSLVVDKTPVDGTADTVLDVGFYEILKKDSVKVNLVKEGTAKADYVYKADGVLHNGTKGNYIVLADGCKIYMIVGTTVTEIEQDAIAATGMTNAIAQVHVNVYVAATDGWGNATMLYVVPTT